MGRPIEEVNMQRIVLILGTAALVGCGTFKEAGEGSGTNGTLEEYEASFRPSDHDQPLRDFFPEASTTEQKDSAGISNVTPTQPQELTQGYRVQVFATSSYDDAMSRKATVEDQFADEWFYLVYDAPTYKLRAGNFHERYEADRFAKLLSEKGYRDAWVVPERVHKDPIPRTTQPPGLKK